MTTRAQRAELALLADPIFDERVLLRKVAGMVSELVETMPCDVELDTWHKWLNAAIAVLGPEAAALALGIGDAELEAIERRGYIRAAKVSRKSKPGARRRR